MGSPFDGEAAISPQSGYARHGRMRKMHRLACSAMTALLTVAAMLTVVAIRQKDSHDKRFLLSR